MTPIRPCLTQSDSQCYRCVARQAVKNDYLPSTYTSTVKLSWPHKGPFKSYVMGVGGVKFSGKKRYEGVRFNVISVMRGWVGVQLSGKKRYVTLEWPLSSAAV